MPVVIGYDTETNQGPPITVQFYSEQLPEINDCIFVKTGNVLEKTLRHLAKHCRTGEFTIYGYNLKFDLLSLFYKDHPELVAHKGSFALFHRDWVIEGVYGNPTFCTLTNDRGIRINFVDASSWFMNSPLAKVAELVCPGLPKLDMPEDLGLKDFKPSDRTFVDYAMRDAEIAYHAGMQIDTMHQEFDLVQCISAAQMAQSIFQQHYIQESVPIWNAQHFMNEGAMSSYHGGKNNTIPGAAPAWHEPVDAWDLSSAYPHAMTELPAFSKPELYVGQKLFSKRSRSFPEHGIYCISGKAERCNWPVIFDRDFKPISGAFEDVWVTGYELNEARRMGELTLTKVWGHIYDSDKDPVNKTAFARYVEDFYKMKQEASNPIYRHMYKLLLNSLYGKFIQLREVETATGQVKWKSGPLYSPFIASLITGHTRAVMHRLEHEVEALHTATDGVFCPQHKSPANGFSWAPQSGLGSIENEGRGLELCLLRNKCYLLYEQGGNGIESVVRPGYSIHKFAKHGFQGSIHQLEECAMTDKREYIVHKPNTLKMALKQGKVPNKFEDRLLSLNVEPIKAHFNHSN